MTGTKEQALAAESQAIGRAYRQGQKGQVTVVRFVIRNTIDHELYSRNTESKEEKGTTMNQLLTEVLPNDCVHRSEEDGHWPIAVGANLFACGDACRSQQVVWPHSRRQRDETRRKQPYVAIAKPRHTKKQHLFLFVKIVYVKYIFLLSLKVASALLRAKLIDNERHLESLSSKKLKSSTWS